MSGKSGDRRRKLRKPAILNKALGKRMKILLGNA
jgi:ribosomal protein L35